MKHLILSLALVLTSAVAYGFPEYEVGPNSFKIGNVTNIEGGYTRLSDIKFNFRETWIPIQPPFTGQDISNNICHIFGYGNWVEWLPRFAGELELIAVIYGDTDGHLFHRETKATTNRERIVDSITCR